MEEKDQNYEFMTETIKKPPVNKRKLFRKIFSTIIFGILFGACAAATFVMFMPRLQAYLYPVDETKPVSLPVDESIQEEEPVEPFVMPENDTSTDAADPDKAQSPEETAKPDEDAQDTSKPADAEKPEEEKEVVVNNIVETIEKDLELDDYRSLLRKISAIADATSKSLVTVAGVSPNTDWFNNSYENNNSTTGIIIADNGKELLIVSPSDILHKARNVRVTFCDGVTYPARVKDADINTDLCIVSIEDGAVRRNRNIRGRRSGSSGRCSVRCSGIGRDGTDHIQFRDSRQIGFKCPDNIH